MILKLIHSFLVILMLDQLNSIVIFKVEDHTKEFFFGGDHNGTFNGKIQKAF